MANPISALPERPWPVDAATTANITLSGTQTVDGVALTAGMLCLVKDQTTASQNGIYVVSTNAWPRAVGFYPDDPSQAAGMDIPVKAGTINGGRSFRLITTGAITWGTTGITFVSGAHRLMHSWAPIGAVAVSTLPGMYISLATGERKILTKIRYACASGSGTISFLQNGTGVTGLTGLAVSTTAASQILATPVALAEDDYLTVQVTASTSMTDFHLTAAIESWN